MGPTFEYFRHNVKTLPKFKDLEQLANSDSAFGRKRAAYKAVSEWCKQEGLKSVYISVKRRSHAAALKEFRDLYTPVEYFSSWTQGFNYRADSIKVIYR
jgi:hypothetical protein